MYTDASVFSYVGRIIENGGMPYRDTFDHKGPLIYLFNYIGIKICDWGGVYYIELFALFITFLFIYRTSRLYCGKIFSISILLIFTAILKQYFDGGNLTEEFALPFISLSTYIFTDYFFNRRINKIRLILCGISFAAVCLLRPNMISLWIVMCTTVLIECLLNKEQHTLYRFILFFVIGFLLLSIPILLWLIINNSFNAFIDNFILFNIDYTNNFPKDTILLRRVNCFVYFLNTPVILFSFLSSLWFCYIKRNIFSCAIVCYEIISLILIAMSGKNLPHYGMVLIPIGAQSFSQLVHLYQDKHIEIVFLFLSFFLVSSAFPFLLKSVENAVSQYTERNKNHFDPVISNIANVIKEKTEENERIIVVGNWDIIYNMSNRFAASIYSYQNAPCTIHEERKKEFFDEIEAHPPKIVVIAYNASLRSEAEDFIMRHDYLEVLKTEYGNSTVNVYELQTF